MSWQDPQDPEDHNDWMAKALTAELMVLLHPCPACLTKPQRPNKAMGPLPQIDPQPEHLNNCLFRPTKCRIVNCGWEGKRITFIPHVDAFHKSNIKSVELTYKYAQHYIFNFSNSPPSFEDWIIYRCDGEFFWKYTYLDNDKNILMTRFYHLIKNREPMFSYYGIQTFKDTANPNFRYIHSMLADTKDIKEEEINELSPYSMVVPSGELGNFSKGENSLNYTFQIWKRPKSWID